MTSLKILGFCILIAGFSALAMAQSSPQANTMLVARSGSVEIQRGSGWAPLALSERVNAGDRVRTGAGSSAAIQIEPGKIITLKEQSEIQLRSSNGSQQVRLDAGSMKVFSATDMQVAAKDTVLESAERPLDMEVGLQGDRLNVTVLGGAVRNGSVVIRGIQDPGTRTYTADGVNGRQQQHGGYQVVYPTISVFPYFFYGNGNQGTGAIVPPTVMNPMHPAYRPTQIVPPMSDPIRVPVQQNPR